MKRLLLFILPFALMACQDESDSVSANDDTDNIKEMSSSSVAKSSSSVVCNTCEKGYFVQAEYSENIGKPIIDSSSIWPCMDMSLKKFGIDGLAFDAHVVSSVSPYNDLVHGFIHNMEYKKNYAPFLSEIPDSLVHAFVPLMVELNIENCRYYLLGFSAGQQPYAYVVTGITKDTVDMVSILRSPKEGFSCRYDNAIVSDGFVIEDCGDGVVPESDFVVRRSSVESPLWTCESSI